MATKAKVKPKKAKPPKLDTKGKAEVFDRVAVLEDERREALQVVELAKQRLKSAKETYAGIQAELNQAIWENAHPEAHPLFHQANGKASSNGQAGVAPVAFTPADDSWKAVQLGDALEGLSKSILEKLHQANLHTMGELAAWTAEDGGRHRITDIPGVGAKAAEKIEEACTAFWARQKAAQEQRPASSSNVMNAEPSAN